MKRIIAYTLVSGLILLTGCIKDDRNNFMVDDSVTLTATGTVQESSVHSGSYAFGVAKSGKGQTAAKAFVTPDGAKTLLQKYNAEQKERNSKFVELEAIPSDKFTLEGADIVWTASEFVKEVKVNWDVTSLADYVGSKENYVIPLTVVSPDLEVNGEKNLILIHITRSEISLQQTVLTRVIESSKVEPGEDGTQPQLKENFIFDVELSHAIKGVGLRCPVKIDNSLVAAFSEMQGETYTAAPEGLFTLESDAVTIAESGRSATFRGVLDKSKLLVDGKLQEFPPYVIPVRLSTGGITSTRGGESFNLKGLSEGNTVAYIALTYKQSHTGILSITREWGRYSTSAAAWNEYYGGTANTDRNVAIDNEFIYIAETNTSKNLWAISIADPTQVKKLPVGTVKSDGTFHLCCPRVIPNTDPAVNGGKDVLCVSNMSMDGDADNNPPTTWLYVYDKGINADPSPVGLKTWASRRLGDTFTWWGTFQDGVLFFKDMSSAAGTVTFWMEGRTTGNLNLQGRLQAPAISGAGAYFPFPDNINRGIGTTRGGEKAWLVYASKDLKTMVGADASPTQTELAGYFVDAAFRFFEYGGKRYIAYSRQVSPVDGRLFILEGELTDTWEAILEARARGEGIVYQAAIQEEAEMQDNYNASPRSSGHSGMDIDCCFINGDVYIAVVKQNVGLSLFRMTK